MTEPFPPLHGALPPSTGGGIARRRRKSSGLGADVPGDVDVPSFATSRRLDGVNMKSPVELVGWLQALRAMPAYRRCLSLLTLAEIRQAPALETPYCPPRSLQVQACMHTTHMAAAAHPSAHHRRALRCLPASLEPNRRLSVPLVPSSTRRRFNPRLRSSRPQCAHALWQGCARLRIRRLLYHRPELHA